MAIRYYADEIVSGYDTLKAKLFGQAKRVHF